MDSVYSSESSSGVTPLALVSVGLQLRFESRSQHWQFWGLAAV
jgi:hypothetical protein